MLIEIGKPSQPKQRRHSRECLSASSRVSEDTRQPQSYTQVNCSRLIVERVLMKSTNVAAALMSVILDRKPNSRFALICTMNNFELSKQACPRR